MWGKGRSLLRPAPSLQNQSTALPLRTRFAVSRYPSSRQPNNRVKNKLQLSVKPSGELWVCWHWTLLRCPLLLVGVLHTKQPSSGHTPILLHLVPIKQARAACTQALKLHSTSTAVHTAHHGCGVVSLPTKGKGCACVEAAGATRTAAAMTPPKRHPPYYPLHRAPSRSRRSARGFERPPAGTSCTAPPSSTTSQQYELQR